MAENVIDWTMTNWITVIVMTTLGFMGIFILVAIYTKISNKGGSSGSQAS